MNEAKTYLDSGNLKDAIEAALGSVKSNPTDAKARTFLFELSCFSGDWERATRQLDVIGHQDVNAMIGSQIYRQCVEAEQKRARFFSESLKPEFLATPPDYVYGLLTANNRLREGNAAEARGLLDKVDEERPAFTCKINGRDFADFRDYNDSTSCILEAIVKDSYVWIPFEQIVKIKLGEMKSLRDLFWIQAEVETDNGTNGEMFIPALYANSWKSDDDMVRLGRMTDWRDAGSEIFIGEGMRMFWADGQDLPVLELKEIEFIKD
ncbi:MAG: type VI secretion system accessory protein TagJ [Pyrinomonadaceae bacterium]